jgi:hypothetical protein
MNPPRVLFLSSAGFGPDFRVRTGLWLILITDLNHMTSVLDDVLSVLAQDTLAPLGI